MTPQQIVTWARAQDAAGKRDAMGYPFTSWLIARYDADGRAVRDQHGHQVFEPHAAHGATATETKPASGQFDLFA